MPFLFKFPDRNLDNSMDRDGMDAARSTTAVRTVATVTGFVKVSDRRITQEEKKLMEFKANMKRFEKFLKLRLEREQLDVVATAALQEYRTQLAKSVIAKRASIAQTAVELQRLRLTQAQQQNAVNAAAIDADKAIAQLRQTQQAIRDRSATR